METLERMTTNALNHANKHQTYPFNNALMDVYRTYRMQNWIHGAAKRKFAIIALGNYPDPTLGGETCKEVEDSKTTFTDTIIE